MDIHKPKLWHGLRDFLKEHGIIVLGVLTALAAEQAVNPRATNSGIHACLSDWPLRGRRSSGS
jgi:hypothetical protein